MTISEKILQSLKSSMTYLENSMQALDKKDEDSLADSLWHAGAELEYVLFLFSVTFQDESNLTQWKPNPELKKVETGPKLVEVQNFLKEVAKSVMDKKLLDAHRKASIARYYMLKVQEALAKEKREALKKK